MLRVMNSTMLTLELQPIDPPKAAPTLPEVSAEIEIVPLGANRAPPFAPVENTDGFLREATHQYAEGHLDQPLWDRAFAQAKSNKDAAVDSYLHARAVALRLLDRERRSGKRADVAPPVNQEQDEATEWETLAADDVRRRHPIAKYRNAIFGAAVLLSLGVGGWLFNPYWNAKTMAAPAMIPTAPVDASATTGAPAVTAAASTAVPGATPIPSEATAELMLKIQDLRAAGNANVLVFYLAEWTRKEPANPAAWDQLRAGYVTLKQYDDALGAAKKALELAPDEPRMWRTVGAAHADVGDTAAALRAFDQAVARDERDVESFRQIGNLNAQLNQFPEAGRAFDRALAINPGDQITLCMRSAVAQLSSAPKDTYAIARQVKVIDGKCRGS
jgi:tetratricopeptide (TPR) repeat protein